MGLVREPWRLSTETLQPEIQPTTQRLIDLPTANLNFKDNEDNLAQVFVVGRWEIFTMSHINMLAIDHFKFLLVYHLKLVMLGNKGSLGFGS